MDLFYLISSNLHNLANKDPMIFIQSCEILVKNSQSLTFKEIVSQKLQHITPILVEKAELSDKEAYLKYYLPQENAAYSDFVSLEENSFNYDLEASVHNTRFHSSNIFFHLVVIFDAFFLHTFIPFFVGELFAK